MRIRKRPPLLPFYPSPSQNPDPSVGSQPPNGREIREERVVGREERKRERGRGRGGALHPDGDLPVDPQYGWSTDLPPSDPHPFNLTHEQVLKEEKEVELDSSSSHKTWDAQVNNNKSSGSSSGATVSSVMGAAIGQWWCDQESAVVVPKKRRGGVEIGIGIERNGRVKATAKSTTTTPTITAAAAMLNNSISISSSSGNSDGVVKEEGNGSVNGKKRRSPAVLMEGSRCSRVNGRGWRCCQQTLVGYSLCEHHLGKGRLKSMSSIPGVQVSNSSRKPKKNYSEEGDDGGSAVMLSSPQKELEEERQKQCLGVDNGEKKEKKKIGTVKARSISSLLDEPDHPMTAMKSSSPVLTPDSNMALV